MPSVVSRLTEKGLIRPPTWLPGNVRFEGVQGSVAYGAATDDSDYDMVGWCVPPKDMVFPHQAGHIEGFGRQKQKFICYQQHHVVDGTRVYDINIYNIVHYFHLCMENNPNMILSLFLPAECIMHTSIIGNMVREKRHIFLHKGCWHRFKGYAYSQLAKMETKSPLAGSKRASIVEEFGYDCYVEDQTEFLTNTGWQRFDDVDTSMKLATISIKTGQLQWQSPLERVDKQYTGAIYELHPSMSRCQVTPGHQILHSPAHRSLANNFSSAYTEDKADWKLTPLQDFEHGYRSHFHIRRTTSPNQKEYLVEDRYLKLAGLFIADGTIGFRGNKVKDARVTQSKGDRSFYDAADSLGLRRYDYKKETVWTIPRKVAERLYGDFGHGSRKKRLPNWCFQLSYRQADLFFHHLWLGDGTKTPAGDVYYSTNEKLAGDIQAMLTSSGHLCSVRGPYIGFSTLTNTDVTSYQVYRSNEVGFACIDLKRLNKPKRSDNQGNQIKRFDVTNCRVVCFTVPNGTLITRCKGKVAIQGNCKFACHLVRLMYEVEQILTTGDLDPRRNSEELKSIRRGEWSVDKVKKFFAEKEQSLERLYENCDCIPWSPREDEIKQLLLDCLEEHWGTLEGCIITDMTPVLALREIAAVIDKNRGILG